MWPVTSQPHPESTGITPHVLSFKTLEILGTCVSDSLDRGLQFLWSLEFPPINKICLNFKLSASPRSCLALLLKPASKLV